MNYSRLSLFLSATLLTLGQCFGLPTNSVGLVSYTAFNGTSYTLQPWLGEKVAILTPVGGFYQSNVMARILSALDQAWTYYAKATGGQPAAYDPTFLQGHDTIAVVNDTCGAGCSYVGYTGTEILSQYFQTLYDGVASANQYEGLFAAHGPQRELEKRGGSLSPSEAAFASNTSICSRQKRDQDS